MTSAPLQKAGRSTRTTTATEVVPHSVPRAPDETRRKLKRARRVLGAALAQSDVDPELLAAAELVAEAGGRR